MQAEKRIDLIVLTLFTCAALAVPATIIARHFLQIDPLALLRLDWGRTVAGSLFGLLATLTTALNFYLAVIAPWRHRSRHGNLDDYHSISGLPLIGGFFILGAAALLPASSLMGICLLLLYSLDSGGLAWFFYAMLTRQAG